MRALLMTALVVVAFALHERPAAACECVEVTPRGAAQNARAIFTGRVTSATSSGIGTAAVAFDVDTIYKGDVPPAARVVADIGMCGYRFQPGARYTVFAYTSPGEEAPLRTNGCMGNVAGAIDATSYAIAPSRVIVQPLGGTRATDIVVAALALLLLGAYAYRRSPPEQRTV